MVSTTIATSAFAALSSGRLDPVDTGQAEVEHDEVGLQRVQAAATSASYRREWR